MWVLYVIAAVEVAAGVVCVAAVVAGDRADAAASRMRKRRR